ncbi:DUF3955 domain-containing protein [Paraclostridium bifermentans]|uniref:DUF3955 domain-containing protein n=1 Tax=Paraclostridium bifermentans TaxID=1490 RepID=UPI001158D7D1|nr:DUF3955 domain-containing protein [Paraclostridium bifermentans]TQO56989.1 DUF3955 domain-containing protein [Paraclostridium bifermentans]GKZ04946.1 hypothetical protein ANS014_33800 [Paraclostridium bifermentans]GKZ08325.1 hypothetical protein ANS015_32080 [Paraclostridium bifermentans]GKZ11747.1 hypothetical protein ANS017_31310 [Paraclostridium bifermentans]
MKKNILYSIPFLIAIGCLVIFNIIGSEVAADGTLIEPFFLIPIFWLFSFIGILTLIFRVILSLFKKKHFSQ